MVRAVVATAAPSAAKRRAIALPSPRLPPVTRAILPSNTPPTFPSWSANRDTRHMAGLEIDVERLTARLAPAGVEDVHPLTGGASSLSYAGTVGGPAGRRVVVKVAPPGVAPVLNRDVLRQA